MAIDTADRRYSMIGFGNPGPSLVVGVPDGTFGGPGRATFLGLYSGITLTEDAPEPPAGLALMRHSTP